MHAIFSKTIICCKLVVLLAVALTGASCSKKPSGQNKVVSAESDQIVSDRAQNFTKTIMILKLQTPSLLMTAKKVDGKMKIDTQQATAISEEQKELMERLQAISSEIKVLAKYRLVLNAVAVVVPIHVAAQVSGLPGVSRVENVKGFQRPASVDQAAGLKAAIDKVNSVSFIAADLVHAEGVRGQGMKVGIIDTGIDYTHAMLGGEGSEEAFKNNNPDITNAAFPNAKVVGGIDLVGTSYDSASALFENRIPRPDANPIDQGGHGTHVAGTVAGLGDGENTYSGVAPDAKLYAIKVFGAKGSTNEDVVISGLEYAADPNGDLNLEDQLDVVNLSLGSEFGTAHTFYREAVANLSGAGTVVVASAGNSGPEANIVGSPSISEEAISVAASIDAMEHNWKFNTVKFISVLDQEKLTSELVEGSVSKSAEEAGDVQGELVFVGLANEDFSEELAAKLKGRVALIDRGVVTFAEKLTRVAKAGAIGAVVVNNQDGEAFSMGGERSVDIPGVMITKALGVQIKAKMQSGDVRMYFKSEDKVEKPQLIDNITGFSSQGPRSEDALIKPEISAPGQNVISAAMGKGKAGVKMSGTSMSGPHIAGVMALLKQSHKDMTSKELKSLLMGTAKTIKDSKGQAYRVSRMGAGRVQVDKAVHSALIATEVGISLGVQRIEKQKVLRRVVDFKNISTADLDLSVVFEGSPQIQVATQSLQLKPQESKTLVFDFKISASNMTSQVQELDGFLLLKKSEAEVFRLPVLASVAATSQIRAGDLVVNAGSELESANSIVDLTLKNTSSQSGEVQLFNLLGTDERKAGSDLVAHKSKACDLQAAGYRISGGKLQIAVKLFEAVSTWNLCDISVLIDTDGDDLAEQELVGVPMDRIAGLPTKKFRTLLLNATKMRSLRLAHEQQVAAGKETKSLNYAETVLADDEMKFFNSSSVAIIQMNLEALGIAASGEMRFKLLVNSQEDSNVEPDDYLSTSQNDWMKIDLLEKSQSYLGLDQKIVIEGASSKVVNLTKAEGSRDLLALFPHNRAVVSAKVGDEQVQVVKAQFGAQAQ
jgi:minor extracellular serine protease Vpr